INWPSNSSDLNPIENLWSIVKGKVEKRWPKNLTELEWFMVEEWKKISESILENLVGSMKERCKFIIEKNEELNDKNDKEVYRPLGGGFQTDNNSRNYERIIIQRLAYNTEYNTLEISDSSEFNIEINNQNINSLQDFEQEVLNNYLDQIKFDTESNHNSELEFEPKIMAIIIKSNKFSGSSKEDLQE
ncbi:1117_t:CDS:2, partial [Dentiscutata erythropus]